MKKAKGEFLVVLPGQETFDFNALNSHDRRMMKKNAPKLYAKIMHAMETGEGVVEAPKTKEQVGGEN